MGRVEDSFTICVKKDNVCETRGWWCGGVCPTGYSYWLGYDPGRRPAKKIFRWGLEKSLNTFQKIQNLWHKILVCLYVYIFWTPLKKIFFAGLRPAS